MSIAAYRTNQVSIESDRQREARIFRQVTHALEQSRTGGYLDLVKAARDNEMFWNVLMEDMASQGNALPDALKANLISIGLAVGRITSAVISSSPEERSKHLDDLIAINRSIEAGLS